jgi:hypothetical protein
MLVMSLVPSAWLNLIGEIKNNRAGHKNPIKNARRFLNNVFNIKRETIRERKNSQIGGFLADFGHKFELNFMGFLFFGSCFL